MNHSDVNRGLWFPYAAAWLEMGWFRVGICPDMGALE